MRQKRLSLIAAVLLFFFGAGVPLSADGPTEGKTDCGHAHQELPAKSAAASEELGSMSIPDPLLLDQNGNEVRFYSELVKDRVVVINFIFTTCTTICPPMGANFSKLQKMMGPRVGRDFELISISVDPAVDTPERLKAWAEKFGPGPGWTLLTGSKPEIDKLLKALKVFTADKTDHSPIVLLGDDARGRWTRAYGLASPTTLAGLVDELIGPAESPKLAGAF